MQKFQRTTIFILLLLCAPSILAVSPFDGDWFGGFELPESHVIVQIHFRTANDRTTGKIDMLDMGKKITMIEGSPLDKLELNPSCVHFELTDKARPLSFDGQITNGVMTGTVLDGGVKLPFRLDLMAKIHPSRYTGIYQVGPGHFISIAPYFAPEITALMAFDIQSGQYSFLLPRSGTDFVCGSGAKIYPVQAAIHFTTNQLGRVTTLQWTPESAPVLVGTRMKALPHEDLSLTNGDVTLSGTLLLPPTKGPHPAVVLVDGSGPSVRTDLRLFADFFALNGVAVLIYDKRGCGHSTGDWTKSGLDDLAGDALAGLELLKNQPDINPHQIGLWGISQGGWIVPLAASRCADVAFIISVSGPGITPKEQVAYCVEHWVKAAGYSEADVTEAYSLSLLTFQCRATDRGWNELEAARKADQNKPWYNACPFLDRDGPGVNKFFKLLLGYDPVPTLRKVRCPVLSIFGELDPLVPAQKSADIWEAALAKAGNHDVVIKIFPHAIHSISDPQTGAPAPGFFALQRDWLLKHVTVYD